MESKAAWLLSVMFALMPGMASAQTASLPTVWVIVDSTANSVDHRGWGDPFAAYFDPAKVAVVNRARAGRTFLTEGLWDRVQTDLKPGDFVLIQFGHNDGGPPDKKVGPEKVETLFGDGHTIPAGRERN